MSGDLSNNKTLVKAVSAGLFAGLANQMLQGSNANSTASGIFGTSVGAGILITSLITQQIPDSYSSGVTSGVAKRGLEITGTTAGTYLVYNKVMPMAIQNVRLPEFDIKTAGIIIAADFAGELMYQWVSGETSLFQ
jgi:hypothetical protein